MSQQLAPSDWTQETFQENPSVLRGIIRGIDEQLGIGVIASANLSQGSHIIFFLCDITHRLINSNNWQHGIGEGDNIEFELFQISEEDSHYIQQSYLFAKYNFKLFKSQIATNLFRLDTGTVILEELLFDHPRYEGVIVTEPEPSIQHHAFGSYYGDDEPFNGLIRLVAPYKETQIPPINERYNISETQNTNNSVNLLQAGTMLTFSGMDLLTTRIVLRKGDRVEFDVYRDKSNNEVPFGATNIIFLDADNSQRQHGFIYRFLSRQQSHGQYAGNRDQEQKFGLIKSTYHEELFWHQSEILDRDEIISIGEEVEFIREIDEMHGRLKASRISFLPKNTIQLTELSSEIFNGKIIINNNKAPLIEYNNNISQSKQLIEVQIDSDKGYVLVKGDQVQFRTESKHENPTNKRAVHVVVTKEVDRTHKGVISSVPNMNDSYGEIEYNDRGGQKHSIYFYFNEWFCGNVDIYNGLSVEFNILERNNKKRAVRIRPLILPLTKQERLIRKKQQKQQRQQEIRQNMLSNIPTESNIEGRDRGNNRGRTKPPLISNDIRNVSNVSNDEINDDIKSNKSLSKGKSRRMRKRKNKVKNKGKYVKESSDTQQSNPSKQERNEGKDTHAQRERFSRERRRDDRDRHRDRDRDEGKVEIEHAMPNQSNPIPSFDTMIPIEGIVVSPMRSKHGRGTIRYKWKHKRGKSGKSFEEEKIVEYDYDQKANWQRSIFLTEGDKVRLFFRSITEDEASLAYVALLDPVYKQRMYGQCYYYHPTKNYYLRCNNSQFFIELWSYHIVDKKVQSYNLDNEWIVFDMSERINYNNDNKIGTRCRWVRLEDKQWFNGKIVSVPSEGYTDYGCISYYDVHNECDKKIRFSLSSLSKQYKNYEKIGDEVKFHIEHVITKSTYDVIAPTAVHVDTTQLYRQKNDTTQLYRQKNDAAPVYRQKNKKQSNTTERFVYKKKIK